MTDYKYLIFDGQYILTRNFYALLPRYRRVESLIDSSGFPVLDDDGKLVTYSVSTLTWQEIAKLFIYTIAKFTRDIANCRKLIILFDKSPYHKNLFVEGYKGSRTYVTEDDLLDIDKELYPLDYAKVEEDIRVNNLKQEAKSWLVDNLGKIGMQVYMHPGYEADDLAYIISNYLKTDDQKSAIVSKDNDWTYLINENVDFLEPTGKVYQYKDRYCEVETNVPKEYNLSLYQYKSLIDSLHSSHNDLGVSITQEGTKLPTNVLIESILSGDKTYVSDQQLLDSQLESFKVENYPEYSEVLEKITNLDKQGIILDENEFSKFASDNKLKISTNYYSTFIEYLDKTLYDTTSTKE